VDAPDSFGEIAAVIATFPRVDGFHEQVAFIFGEVPVVAFRMQPVIALPAA
jgi:hypothetical protein